MTAQMDFESYVRQNLDFIIVNKGRRGDSAALRREAEVLLGQMVNSFRRGNDPEQGLEVLLDKGEELIRFVRENGQEASKMTRAKEEDELLKIVLIGKIRETGGAGLFSEAALRRCEDVFCRFMKV